MIEGTTTDPVVAVPPVVPVDLELVQCADCPTWVDEAEAESARCADLNVRCADHQAAHAAGCRACSE